MRFKKKSDPVYAAYSRIKALFPSANLSELEIDAGYADTLLRASVSVLEEFLSAKGIETMDQDLVDAWEKRLTEYEDNLNACTPEGHRAVLANLIMVAVFHEEEETARAVYNQLKAHAEVG